VAQSEGHQYNSGHAALMTICQLPYYNYDDEDDRANNETRSAHFSMVELTGQ